MENITLLCNFSERCWWCHQPFFHCIMSPVETCTHILLSPCLIIKDSKVGTLLLLNPSSIQCMREIILPLMLIVKNKMFHIENRAVSMMSRYCCQRQDTWHVQRFVLWAHKCFIPARRAHCQHFSAPQKPQGGHGPWLTFCCQLRWTFQHPVSDLQACAKTKAVKDI